MRAELFQFQHKYFQRFANGRCAFFSALIWWFWIWSWLAIYIRYIVWYICSIFLRRAFYFKFWKMQSARHDSIHKLHWTFFCAARMKKRRTDNSTAIIVYENCEHSWNLFFRHFEHITRIIQTYVWTFFYTFVWQNAKNVPFLLWNLTLTAFLHVFFAIKYNFGWRFNSCTLVGCTIPRMSKLCSYFQWKSNCWISW